MGKYKDGGKSILISSIPPEELGEAFKEWANGNEVMAELLYTCYKNGLETFGNHFGPHSYIDFFVNNSQKVIQPMLKYMQDIDSVMVFIMPDGGHPCGNKEAFWKPTMSVGFGPIEKKEDAEEIIRGMTAAIKDSSSKKEIEEGAFDSLIDFHDFFAGKGSNLFIRAKYDNEQYRFSIEGYHNHTSANNIEYFKGLFEKAGLSYEKIKTEGPLVIDEWSIVSNKKEDFREKLVKAEEIIEANWTYEKPTQIEENMSLNEKARIKMEQYGRTPEGMAKFKEWLEEQLREEQERIEMKEVVSNAIECGTTTEQVQEADNVEHIEIQEQEMEGVTKDD